ncbi:M15 family metallopeptidase [Aestuariirhabdus sp. Z084]|uniref:M15 family metallopeptidase n=1 Tax=Aestuariirhabdus haliotis TaxID=2918751 RepID=UPI00201B4583|nr:M15 family metallopeptidase [Aestuariirhabdus haliotis]MCL6416062.1 M15 family metallopeptidase [Aestuariirhabdus haliotis]MCL6419370.1 M15 family metallopeptidase [Aestuariirhabdus haliotis]
MKRREFLEGVLAGTAVTASSAYLWGKLNHRSISTPVAAVPASPATVVEPVPVVVAPEPVKPVVVHQEPQEIAEDRAYLSKIQNFDDEHIGDIHLSPERAQLLKDTLASLDDAQRLIGHGHFNVVGFDQMIKMVNRYSKQGDFPKQQLDLIEELFEFNAQNYGFYGEKIVTRLTSTIPGRDIEKIPYTGHYLYKGDSKRLYQTLRRDVGETIVLTSGIRGMVKQTHLFMAKALQAEGNLSRASRSLAPPGHSYHAIGDFDVGKIGYGKRNFTRDFAQTDEYKRLQDLGYVDIRYTSDNRFGVRYEPWHVKVV